MRLLKAFSLGSLLRLVTLMKNKNYLDQNDMVKINNPVLLHIYLKSSKTFS